MHSEKLNAKDHEAQHLLQVYGQLDIEPTKAEGVYLHCGQRRLTDWYGGHAVAALGYGHPDLVTALQDQARNMFFQSNAVALPVRARAADALAAFAPAGLNRVFFANSGAEANENALRIAMRLTGRKRVAAIEHGFHGRTAAAGAVTWGAVDRWYGYPRAPFDVDFIPRNDQASVDKLVGSDTAAVILELVQGLAGAFDLDQAFVQKIAQACKARGALLIIDEVQTGIGRCGAAFATELYDIQPDLLTSAKSLAGGFPCGAVLTTDDIAKSIKQGDLGSTFGGGPMACALVETVLKVIQRDQLIENVGRLSGQIAAALPLGPITGLQGKGFLLGLRCARPASGVLADLLKKNLLAGSSTDPNILRLLPALIMEQQHVDQLLEALAQLPAA